MVMVDLLESSMKKLDEGYLINFYEVWLEGYTANGERGYAQYLGNHPGKNFADACRRALIYNEWPGIKRLYNPDRNTYCGCRFFDNEADARKSFG